MSRVKWCSGAALVVALLLVPVLAGAAEPLGGSSAEAAQLAGPSTTGNIAIFKTMCDRIGQLDTCNGRDTSLSDYKVDFLVHAGADNPDQSAATAVQKITVTLSDNANGKGNTGNGEPGIAGYTIYLLDGSNAVVTSTLTDALGNYTLTPAPGTYLVCEAASGPNVLPPPAPPVRPYTETQPDSRAGAPPTPGTQSCPGAPTSTTYNPLGYVVTITSNTTTGRDFGNAI